MRWQTKCLTIGGVVGCVVWAMNGATQLLYDPRVPYQTIRTEHFEIHYPDHLWEDAKRVAVRADTVYQRVTNLFGWRLRQRTHVVISDNADQPNPSSGIYPQPTISFDITLPSPTMGINDYADYDEWLLTHEFSHVVLMEMVVGGYRFAAPIFGPWRWVRPGMNIPPWLQEGVAVYIESALTPAGRGTGTTYRMIMRAAVAERLLDDSNFASLDALPNYGQKHWPWSIRPYLFGYYMVREIAKDDPRRLATFSQRINRALPFRLRPGIRPFGLGSLREWWNQTLATIREESERELKALRQLPSTPLEYLTDTGYFYRGLTISPNGRKLVVTREDPDHENAILGFDIAPETGMVSKSYPIVLRSTGYQSSFSVSNRYLALDQSAYSEGYYLKSDIYLYDLKTERFIAKSRRLRAHSPDIYPDGKHLVFIVNQGGSQALVQTDTAWGDRKTLVGNLKRRRLAGPRVSPDGKRIVLLVKSDRAIGEELWLIEGTTKRRLLRGDSHRGSPSWTPDSRMILYSSDQTGVSNIYAIDLETRHCYQLTHTVGGLFDPVVDAHKQWIYAVSYRGRGYDVARFRWDPSTWKQLDRIVPIELPAEAETVSAPAQDQTTVSPMGRSILDDQAVAAEERQFGRKPYSGLRYLMPQYLTPAITWRTDTLRIGGTIGATDPLFQHNWNLVAQYDRDTKLPVGGLFYRNATGKVPINGSISHDATPVSLPTGIPGEVVRVNSRNIVGALGASIPLGYRSDISTFNPSLVAQQLDFIEKSVYFGAQIGYQFNTEFTQIGQSFPESGRYFNVSLGQSFNTDRGRGVTTLSGSYRQHFPLWWTRHALHLSTMAATYLTGRDDPNSIYYAGGAESFPSALSSQYTIYGYEPNSLIGRSIALGDLFYSFELIDIERGLVDVPFYFGRLSGGVRAQVGWIEKLEPGRLPWSIGCELIDEFMFGYYLPFEAKVGLYRGDSALSGTTQVIFSLSGSFW